MNIALSLLSAAASTSEAASGVIDRLQAYTATESQTAAQQHPMPTGTLPRRWSLYIPP